MIEELAEQNTDNLLDKEVGEYNNLVTLESLEHVRLRPGMYIHNQMMAYMCCLRRLWIMLLTSTLPVLGM